jgi:signal transduction histidine kinase
LGLSVVKTIVESHGGRVGLDARQGGGNIFWFTLPLRDVL